MGVHIKWVCPNVGSLRAGSKFNTIESHDPYDFVATVVVVGNIATFEAAHGSYLELVGQRKSVEKQLPLYVDTVTWERFDNKGNFRKTVVIPLKRKSA